MSDIVELLRSEGSDAMRKHLSMGMWSLCENAADEIERLREPFKHADAADWDYIERLLLSNIRHQQDSQTRFWWEAIKAARTAYQQITEEK